MRSSSIFSLLVIHATSVAISGSSIAFAAAAAVRAAAVHPISRAKDTQESTGSNLRFPCLQYPGGSSKSSAKSLILQCRGGYVPGSATKAYIDRLFDSVDKDSDGVVSLDELYERVLLMYININRQAVVPPPTRETVTALFRNADTDRSNLLDRDQFCHIMLVIYSRATARVILAKISKVVLAPLLALQTVRMASCSGCWWEENVVSRVPEKCGFLLDPNVWRTALTVLFVITLSNVVVGAATVVLDGLCGVDKKKEEVDVKTIRA